MEPPRNLPDLLEKYFNGSCSPEELRAFYAWVRQAGEDERLYDQLRQQWENTAREPVPAGSCGPAAPGYQPDWDRMFSRLTEPARAPVRPAGRSWKWAAAAALILVCVSTAVYFAFFHSPYQRSSQKSVIADQTHAITPGSDKALLTLADGSRIVLDSTASRLLARQGGTRIEKDGKGRLIYISPEEEPGEGEAVINTISTPRGGQYQVRLPDGTDVWLNAASTLKFPASFTEDERSVELTGEAYFEVSRDKTRPFLVRSGSQVVEVLGTHFNISAYQDEPLIKTTLITGSIKVIERQSEQSRLLRPGQEATTGASGKVIVAPAVPGQAIAWKNGKFFFNGERIENIMRKVARWYDVEIVYRGNIGDVRFTGSVSRFANVADLLRKLELTGSVHFDIEGRRIIVMP